MIILSYGCCSENHSDVIMLNFRETEYQFFVQIAYLRAFLNLLAKFVVFLKHEEGTILGPAQRWS